MNCCYQHPHCMMRKLRHREVSNLPKVTELVNAGARICAQVLWFKGPLLCPKASLGDHVSLVVLRFVTLIL